MKPSDPFSNANDSDRTIVRPSPGGRRTNAQSMLIRRTSQFGAPEDQQAVAAEGGDNPLITSAFSLLSLVPKLRNLPFHNAVNELQQRLIDELKRFENRALSQGTPRNQMDIAKYLLCSLLDETVLNTPWGSQSGWGHNSLSSLFYKKLVGGEEFFQILDRLKQQPSPNKDLLELAYLCLSLGFEGKYRYKNDGLRNLEAQRQELYLQIEKIKGPPESELSRRWQGIRNATNPLIRYVPLWVLAGIAGVTLMIVYMIFAFAIRDNSDRLYDDLFTKAHNIKKATTTPLVQPLQVVKSSTTIWYRLKKLLADEIAQNKAAIIDEGGLRIFNMFQSGSAEIKREYHQVLVKLAEALKMENARILVVGHTDNQRLKFSQRFQSNWHLSMARAESAKMALGQYGLPSQRMHSKGMADKEPIVPNNTKANRAINRRIEIYIR